MIYSLKLSNLDVISTRGLHSRNNFYLIQAEKVRFLSSLSPETNSLAPTPSRLTISLSALR
jgi:hypothetical protein